MIALTRSDTEEWLERLRIDPTAVLREAGVVEPFPDLWTAARLHTLFDPSGAVRIGNQGFGKALRRSGFANLGLRRTAAGLHTWWAVRNEKHWSSATAAEIAEHVAHFTPASGEDRKY